MPKATFIESAIHKFKLYTIILMVCSTPQSKKTLSYNYLTWLRTFTLKSLDSKNCYKAL